jgi:copper resistance protein C
MDKKEIYMKKAWSILILLLFIFPSFAKAHTTLVSSNPSEAQVITEPMKQITLEFESTLEKLSTLTLLQDSKQIAIGDIQVENNKMIANLPEELQNGNYKIEWKIVGEDGHPISGQISFSVKVKQDENKVPTTNEKTSDKSEPKQSTNSDKPDETTPKEKKSLNPFVFIAIGIFGILIMVGGVMLWNKK